MKNVKIIGFEEFCQAIAAIKTGANYDPRRDMHFIDPKTVRAEAWVKDMGGTYWIPKAVSVVCPHCDVPTGFVLTQGAMDQTNQALDLHGQCSLCAKPVKFFALGCERADRGENPEQKCESIWMYPVPKAKREIIDLEKTLSPRIFRAYTAAITCFNARIWTSTVTECGRTLEGIANDKFPNWDPSKTLYSSLKKLSSELKTIGYFELFESILLLAEALRLGRNKSAHFDFEIEPDEDVATEILNLTERLIDYFYVIPKRSQELSIKIEALGDSAD